MNSPTAAKKEAAPCAVSGFVFNIQRFCTHDGPGIRTTVFLKGCPLRCSWCHNPEGISRGREIVYDPSKCIVCEDCAEVCEENAHTFESDGTHLYHPDRCIRCGQCVEVCYSGALEQFGERKSAREVFEVVLRDKPFYDASGGGVTLSGGEPLYQPEFAAAILTLCREAGIHTALETTCATRWETVERFLPLVDEWMCDVKHMDAERHQALTGSDNRALLENLRRLCESGASVLLRRPLVPGLNDDTDELRALAAFLLETDPKRGFELLPYHRIGADKYRRLRKDYTLGDVPDATEADIRRAAGILREAGVARVSCP